MTPVSDGNPWQQVLDQLRSRMPDDEFRRWFSETGYASDSGDQITVWVPSETARRYIAVHFQDYLDRALAVLDRPDTHIRFVVAGYGDDEDQ